jgi:alpha-beta hydrolase superfamily lysophospholipase
LPDDLLYTNPEHSFKQPPEDVVIRSAGGEENHAWRFVALQKSKAVIVFCHGNGQNRSAHIVGLYWLVKEGYDVLAIDYPGYADNDGDPTPENTVEAAKAAMRFAVTGKPALPLIVYGQSLGGAVALRAVIDLRNEIKPALVVADSTFLSYRRVGKAILASHWLTWLAQPLAGVVLDDRFAPGDEVAKIGAPLLVIHSREDELVPYGSGEEIYNKASAPKEIWSLEKGRHIQTFILPDGAGLRKRFLAKLAAMGM